MRTAGELTFMALTMFFVWSIQPLDPIAWHNGLKALAGLFCAVLGLIAKIQDRRGRKHLISGRSGSVLDIV